MSVRGLIAPAVLALVILAVGVKFTVDADRQWQRFKMEHRCADSGRSRSRIVTVKPPVVLHEKLWQCDNGEHWGK